MQKWDYTMRYCSIQPRGKGALGIAGVIATSLASAPGYPDPGMLWTTKDKSGLTEFDQIKRMGENGWDLINITPINSGEYGSTSSLLFTYKRPKIGDTAPLNK